MKNYFIVLSLLFSSLLMGQNAELNVSVQSACGDLIKEKLQINLYETNGTNSTFLTSKNENPAIFGSLAEGKDYYVRVDIEKPLNHNLSVKDVILAQRHILGINSLPNENVIRVADMNIDGRLTASDVSDMWKLLLEETNYSDHSNWIQFNNPTWPNTNYEEHHIKNLSQGKTQLPITVSKRGHINESIADFCPKNCPDTTDVKNFVAFDNPFVSKDSIVEVLFYLDKNNKYLGVEFSLLAQDAEFIALENISSPHASFDKNNQRVKCVWGSISVFNGVTDLFKLKIKANKSSFVKDLIKIDSKSPARATFEKGECLIHANKLQLQPTQQTTTCDITWPKNIILPSCDKNLETGQPFVSDPCVSFVKFTSSDDTIVHCEKIIRTWKSLNWVNGEILQHYQIIKIDSTFDHICHNDFILEFGENFKYVHAKTFLVNPKEGHQYSFDKNDVRDSIRLFKYEAPLNEIITIYDLTSQSFCLVRVQKKKIIDTSNFAINDTINVFLTNNAYTVFAKDFHKFGLQLPQGYSNMEIAYVPNEFKSSIIFDSSHSGQIKKFSLRYKKNNQWISHGDVWAKLVETNIPERLQLWAYEEQVVGNKEYELEIYASNFKEVSAFQMAFEVQNAEIIELKNGAIDLKNAFNNQGNYIKIAWLEYSDPFKTVGEDEVLFTLVIKPKNTGWISDMLQVSEKLLTSEATTHSNLNSTKIGMDFKFRNRISSTQNIYSPQNVKIFPNPSNGKTFFIEKPDLSTIINHIEIFDIQGKIIQTFSTKDIIYQGNKMECNTEQYMTNGIYLVRIHTDQNIFTHKLVVKE